MFGSTTHTTAAKIAPSDGKTFIAFALVQLHIKLGDSVVIVCSNELNRRQVCDDWQIYCPHLEVKVFAIDSFCYAAARDKVVVYDEFDAMFDGHTAVFDVINK
jgi:hypothetical protein